MREGVREGGSEGGREGWREEERGVRRKGRREGGREGGVRRNRGRAGYMYVHSHSSLQWSALVPAPRVLVLVVDAVLQWSCRRRQDLADCCVCIVFHDLQM